MTKPENISGRGLMPTRNSIARVFRCRQLLMVLAASFTTLPLCAATGLSTNSASDQFRLMDLLGQAHPVSTNAVARELQPPAAAGLGKQIPAEPKGEPAPDEVTRGIGVSKSEPRDWKWFPATPPVLMPYLASMDEYGNTTVQSGAVFPEDPLSRYPQAAKYWLSNIGLRYSFYQSLTLASLTGTAAGASALQYYTATFNGKWAVAEASQGGTAGWITTAMNVQQGLSPGPCNELNKITESVCVVGTEE